MIQCYTTLYDIILYHIICYYSKLYNIIPVSVKKHSSREKDLTEGKLAEHRIRGCTAVLGAGLGREVLYTTTSWKQFLRLKCARIETKVSIHQPLWVVVVYKNALPMSLLFRDIGSSTGGGFRRVRLARAAPGRRGSPPGTPSWLAPLCVISFLFYHSAHFITQLCLCYLAQNIEQGTFCVLVRCI